MRPGSSTGVAASPAPDRGGLTKPAPHRSFPLGDKTWDVKQHYVPVLLFFPCLSPPSLFGFGLKQSDHLLMRRELIIRPTSFPDQPMTLDRLSISYFPLGEGHTNFDALRQIIEIG
jgi:hypothetical protein